MFKKIKIIIKATKKVFFTDPNNHKLILKYYYQIQTFLENGTYEKIHNTPNLVLIKNKSIKRLPKVLESTINDLWNQPNDVSKSIIIMFSILHFLNNLLNKIKNYKLLGENSSNLKIINHNQNIINAQIALIRSNGKIVLFDVKKKLYILNILI